DLFAETEELDVDTDELLTEDDEENDFSLDDFLENNAVDFSKESDESSLEGLSIEDALASLEDDTEDESESTVFDFQSRVSDEEKVALTHIDSSGLDLDSMLDDGASDWSGFNLDTASNTDSELEDEDWSEQPSIENDPHGADRFLSIETLIAESENGDKANFEEEALNLDVGLDEFSDMLGNANTHDVDVNSDAQSKLDLAKAYIEMSDDKGALELLEEVLKCDDPSLKVEAEKLMRQID
ncbi:FimV/HubP family polar landmark protein, partial [uncultured Aliivibrio sp.]|uniref:FimV/HubP family polar landmark protein n=1 Tax=uncultured Aliivibrio sp. TaxID=873085 RepID=UPI0026299D82